MCLMIDSQPLVVLIIRVLTSLTKISVLKIYLNELRKRKISIAFSSDEILRKGGRI